MHYYRVLEGPTPLEHNGQKVEIFTILPEGDGLEGDVPVISCERKLSDHALMTLNKMFSTIIIQFEDTNYEYRAQIQKKNDDGSIRHIVLEVESW